MFYGVNSELHCEVLVNFFFVGCFLRGVVVLTVVS